MARARYKLSAAGVTAFVKNGKVGKIGDGAGLYLVKGASGNVSWVFIYNLNLKRREVGLGRLADVSLADARIKADAMRKQLGDGVDPLLAKREAASALTFKQVADDYYADHSAGWATDRMRHQWKKGVTYCKAIHDVKVRDVHIAHVQQVVKPLVKDKPTTAAYVRSLVKRVIDHASQHGHRDANVVNPASLVATPKHRTKNHPAMGYNAVAAFVATLRASQSVSSRALEMIILTGSRKNEVLGMHWDEIDGDLWVVPAIRMKGRKEHSVPLSARALEILELQREATGGKGYVFPAKKGHLSMAAFKHIELNGATVHGFRSTLRDWLGDCTNHPREVAEGILAHAVGGVEGSYRRGTGTAKRRAALDDWAVYISNSNTGDASKKE